MARQGHFQLAHHFARRGQLLFRALQCRPLLRPRVKIAPRGGRDTARLAGANNSGSSPLCGCSGCCCNSASMRRNWIFWIASSRSMARRSAVVSVASSRTRTCPALDLITFPDQEFAHDSGYRRLHDLEVALRYQPPRCNRHDIELCNDGPQRQQRKHTEIPHSVQRAAWADGRKAISNSALRTRGVPRACASAFGACPDNGLLHGLAPIPDSSAATTLSLSPIRTTWSTCRLRGRL